MLLHRVVLLWHLTSLSSATETSESLSPLAKNIIATLSSSGNAVMRRDFGHERREDLDRHKVELTSLGNIVDAKSHRQPEEAEVEDEVETGETTAETTEPSSETTEMDNEVETTVEETTSTTVTTRTSNSDTTTKATTATTSQTTTNTTTASTTAATTAATTTATTATTSTTTTTVTTTTTSSTTTTTRTETSTTPTSSTTRHYQVQFTTSPLQPAHAMTTTTHSPEHLEAVGVGVAAAAAARAKGLPPEQQAARAGEAAAAAAEAAGLSPMEQVKAAGHAASAAIKALGLTPIEQVRAAVLAAELASQKVQLSPEQEATAAAAAALHAAKLAGLSRQEQAVVCGKVVASVRKGLQDALAFKIQEIHESHKPKSSDAVDAAAAAAASAAAEAAAAAEATAQAAHSVESNTTAENTPPSGDANEDVKAVLKKLAERVLETSARLEKIEKHEGELSDELADKADKEDETKTEAPEPETTEEPGKSIENGGEGVKIPGFMNAKEAPTYWTQGSPSDALQKPVHPHNLQDAVITAGDVAALSPDEVAAILTKDRELLAEVTAKLASANLTDLIFETDASKLPQNAPSEKALDTIVENPEIAKKALNLTLSILGRGVKKLSSGKALSDQLFGSDTTQLIAEEVKGVSTKSSQSKAPSNDNAIGGDIKNVEAPEDPQAVKSVETESDSTTEPPTTLLGMELPSLGLPSFDMPSIPNPMAWFR